MQKVVDLILGKNVIGKIKYKMKFFFTVLKARLNKRSIGIAISYNRKKNFILNLSNKRKNSHYYT